LLVIPAKAGTASALELVIPAEAGIALSGSSFQRKLESRFSVDCVAGILPGFRPTSAVGLLLIVIPAQAGIQFSIVDACAASPLERFQLSLE